MPTTDQALVERVLESTGMTRRDLAALTWRTEQTIGRWRAGKGPIPKVVRDRLVLLVDPVEAHRSGRSSH
jgi:hypothetical protein